MDKTNYWKLEAALTKTVIAIRDFGDEIMWEDRNGRKSRIMNAENLAALTTRTLPENHADDKFDVRIFICAEKRYL